MEMKGQIRLVLKVILLHFMGRVNTPSPKSSWKKSSVLMQTVIAFSFYSDNIYWQ